MIKPCPSYPDYFADELGNAYTTKNHNRFGKKISPKRLKGYFNKRLNRTYVNPVINGKKIITSKSVLVLDAFVSPRPKGMFACHGEKGSTVDSIDNLYWATPKQNCADKYRDGTQQTGENNSRNKLNALQVRIIRRAYKRSYRGRSYDGSISFKYLANTFHVDLSLVSLVVKNKIWKHI